MSTPARSSNLHSVSDAWTWEGIPFQPLSNPPTKNRNCACPLFNRATDKNLVSKPSNEIKERTSCSQGNQRTGTLYPCASSKSNNQVKALRFNDFYSKSYKTFQIKSIFPFHNNRLAASVRNKTKWRTNR